MAILEDLASNAAINSVARTARIHRLWGGDASGVAVKGEAVSCHGKLETMPRPGIVDEKEPTESQANITNATKNDATPPAQPLTSKPKQLHGNDAHDPARWTSDAGVSAKSGIAQASVLVESNVTVTLENVAEKPSGVPDNAVSIITENGRALKLTAYGFKEE